MRASIDELCARYRNENAHTEHVAALALQLFDATRATLRLPASDRPLLEAAGRLHDVGYSVDADLHPLVSRSIVLREGLTGFTDKQRAGIANIIPLHAGSVGRASRPARCLGAFLRIADGLDYSHAQDASIVNVRRAGKTFIVTVRCDAFPHNRARADLKADLWRSVFPVELKFVAPARERQRLPADLRRLLWVQWKTMLVNVDGAMAGETAAPLHDFRVALRRARVLLRMLPRRIRPLERGLARLGDALSTARDADVWIELLRRVGVTGQFLERELAWRQRQQRVVARVLRGAPFAALRRRMNQFLRVEPPKTAVIPPGALDEQLQRLRRRTKGRRARSADELHELRIALRRARYVAEFTGRDALAQRLRACERPLGRVHDIDNGLARPALPAALVKRLHRLRRKHLRAMTQAWKHLGF
jgi:CHAD domain-containing protein